MVFIVIFAICFVCGIARIMDKLGVPKGVQLVLWVCVIAICGLVGL